MTKAVIFDIDGTLIDSVDLHAQAWQETFRHFGREIPFPVVRHEIGKGADQLLPTFFSQSELERFGDALERHRSGLYKRLYLPDAKAFPKVRELFERIRQDDTLIALASSAQQEEVSYYKQLASIENLIDAEVCSEDVERSKPAPDIFATALERLDMDSHQVLVVGDTPYDVQAANKSEIRSVGFLCGGFTEQELRNAGSIAIFRDPEDLLGRYDASPLVKNNQSEAL